LLGDRNGLVAIVLQDAESRLQRAFAHRQHGFLADLVALVAGPLLSGRNGRGAGDIGLLALALLAGELDRFVALGAFARKAALDLGNLRFPSLADQGDLAVAAFLFERQLLLHLGNLAPLGFGGKRDVALGAQLLERLLVLDLPLL